MVPQLSQFSQEVAMILDGDVIDNCDPCSVDKDDFISDVLDPPSQGAVRSWNLRFHRDFHDWEREAVYSFFDRIHTKLPRGLGDDKLSQRLNRSGHFDVRSFYNAIEGTDAYSFPQKSVWWVKVPKRVSFFLWSAAWGKILTIDNLIKRGLLQVNWCCMCRCSGEKVDYLLIHCEIA